MLPCRPGARPNLRQMGNNSLICFNIQFYGLIILPVVKVMYIRIWPWYDFNSICIDFPKLPNVYIIEKEKCSISKVVADNKAKAEI